MDPNGPPSIELKKICTHSNLVNDVGSDKIRVKY
jgi:hypothetical protein